ncbi:MAG: hypothetical protein K0S47_4413 [Herbinix sp.]|nr:hypothetical protein [Herbinix sp.]
MSYTALYRKYRPDSFDYVRGQEPIVMTLKNQIKADRVGHAYLFCGTRGTGKTTIAKILAKVVNCEHPVDGNPCNECRMCRGIASQTLMNVIEIDAASNNGVDNIREIVEEVRYSPTEGRYKVYIIDEVHMLSTGAFNALLKTIEEPPAYVIFILATTEVHKIPVTILSRCQRYDFKRITADIITVQLQDLLREENIDAEEKALRFIARAADGSMRDALSLLDQCISYYLGETLTYDKVLEVLGAVDTEVFTKLLRQIREQSVIGCIQMLEEIETSGRELGQFTIDFTWYLRNLLLLQTSGDVAEILGISSENLAILQQEADNTDAQTLIRFIRIFSELSNQIKYATRKRILIEIALIKLCKPEMEQNYDSILNRVKLLEEKLEKGIAFAPGDMQSTMKAPTEQPVKKAPVILPDAIPEDLKEVVNNWRGIVGQILRKSPALGTVLQAAILSIGEDQRLLIAVTNGIDKDLIEKEEHMTRNEVPDLSKIIKAPIVYED